MLDTCGDAENKLALELSHHEVQIEKDILEPLSTLTEVSHMSLAEEINSDFYLSTEQKRVYLIASKIDSSELVVESGHEIYKM